MRIIQIEFKTYISMPNNECESINENAILIHSMPNNKCESINENAILIYSMPNN